MTDIELNGNYFSDKNKVVCPFMHTHKRGGVGIQPIKGILIEGKMNSESVHILVFGFMCLDI